VVIAAQADGEKKIGRIRLLRVSSAAEASLTAAVIGMVQPGSTVRTDDWNGYQGLPAAGYEREILRPTLELGENLLPGVIGWPACSSAGCCEHIKERCVPNNWTIIWTSSSFGSIAATRDLAASYSIGWLSKQSNWHQVPTPASSNHQLLGLVESWRHPDKDNSHRQRPASGGRGHVGQETRAGKPRPLWMGSGCRFAGGPHAGAGPGSVGSTLAGSPHRPNGRKSICVGAMERVRDFGRVYLGLSLWRRVGLAHGVAGGAGGRAGGSALGTDGLHSDGWPVSVGSRASWKWPSAGMPTVRSKICWECPLGKSMTHGSIAAWTCCTPTKSGFASTCWNGIRVGLGCSLSFLLYDVTSTCFEGQALRNQKAARGYSRDHRPDCKQVNIGLVVTPEGLPIGYEVFAGNTADVTTVEDMVQMMEEKVRPSPTHLGVGSGHDQRREH